MSLPYENSQAGERAMQEIYKILKRFGCQKVGHMLDYETGELRLQFQWQDRCVDFRASASGYAAAWLKEHPYSHRMQRTREEHQRLASAKGQVAIYSILRDWIKGQVTAIETGLLSFEAVFMPHMLLPDGSRLVDHEPQKLLGRISERASL